MKISPQLAAPPFSYPKIREQQKRFVTLNGD